MILPQVCEVKPISCFCGSIPSLRIITMMASLIVLMAAISLMSCANRIKFNPLGRMTQQAPMIPARANLGHVQMHEFPGLPSRVEEARQAWLAKLNDPMWGAVAAAVLEAPSGVGPVAGDNNAAPKAWSTAATTLVHIAVEEEAKAARAGKTATALNNYPALDEKAKAAWHAKIAEAIVPMIAAGLLATGATPAFAGDAGAGEQIFSGNCAACHAGGQNVIMPEKTLEQAAIEEYLDGGANEAAVMKQVTNGKNAMPAFGGRLSDVDIQNVATYVITTAKGGWD